MTRLCSILLSGCILFAGGCAAEDIRDSVWELFGGGYSAGGTTDAERRRHYDAQADRWNSPHQHYDPTTSR